MSAICPPPANGHGADTTADTVSVRPGPYMGAGADTDTGQDTDRRRPRWQIEADTKRAREARRQILKSPRCPVCNQPMTCGQSPTHLSCRPADTRKETR